MTTTTVQRWSGREVRALREAKRMSIRDFAGHLGVSERMISKWEAGGERIIPRPVNQLALDTSLASSGPEVQARFADNIGLTPYAAAAQETTMTKPRGLDPDDDAIPVGDENQLRHPVDGKLMTLVGGGSVLRWRAERAGLPAGVLHRRVPDHQHRLRPVRRRHRRPAAAALGRREAAGWAA